MDSFEYIAARLLEDEGYWTRIGVKVNVSKEEKRLLGKSSLPRPEVDVVAFKPASNELLLVECKSYMDSHGVSMDILAPGGKHWGRLKVFHTPDLRKLIEARICDQLKASGLLFSKPPRIRWVLFAGRIKPGHEAQVASCLATAGWALRGPAEITAQLRRFAQRGYENELATVVIKLLERNPSEATE
jgi:hypothetical protein